MGFKNRLKQIKYKIIVLHPNRSNGHTCILHSWHETFASGTEFLVFPKKISEISDSIVCHRAGNTLSRWLATHHVFICRAGKGRQKYSSFCPVYWSRYKSNGFLGVMSHSAGEVDMSNSKKVCRVNVRSTTIRMCARLPLCNCTIEIWHQHFHRTQVNLGSDLWVRMSITPYATLCRLNWCDSGWWGYQLNTNW